MALSGVRIGLRDIDHITYRSYSDSDRYTSGEASRQEVRVIAQQSSVFLSPKALYGTVDSAKLTAASSTATNNLCIKCMCSSQQVWCAPSRPTSSALTTVASVSVPSGIATLLDLLRLRLLGLFPGSDRGRPLPLQPPHWILVTQLCCHIFLAFRTERSVGIGRWGWRNGSGKSGWNRYDSLKPTHQAGQWQKRWQWQCEESERDTESSPGWTGTVSY